MAVRSIAAGRTSQRGPLGKFLKSRGNGNLTAVVVVGEKGVETSPKEAADAYGTTGVSPFAHAIPLRPALGILLPRVYSLPH